MAEINKVLQIYRRLKKLDIEAMSNRERGRDCE